MDKIERTNRVKKIAMSDGGCDLNCKICPLHRDGKVVVCDTSMYPEQTVLIAKGWLAENEPKENEWQPASTKPSPGVKVIATYKNSLGNIRRIMAWWIPEHWMECNCEYECDCEFDEKLDCSYHQEGWYEVVENWDEWGFIPVTEGEVTHWMLLPEVPK